MKHPRRALARLLACAVLLLLAACGGSARRPDAPLVAGTPRADAANAVLFRAMSLVGTPYRYGGNTPEGGFDCSGLVGYVFRDAAGVQLPRSSAAMSEIGERKLAAATPLLARGMRGGTVRLDSLDGAWWREHFVFGKRVL